MISSKPAPPFEALAALLVKRAEALGRARAEEAALARRNSPRRWRSARLLWPHFAGR